MSRFYPARFKPVDKGKAIGSAQSLRLSKLELGGR